MKQAVLVRTDLKMDKGKMCAQACHASLGSFLKTEGKIREKWLRQGMKKVVLKVSSEKELFDFQKIAKKEKIPSDLIIDAGLTQIEPSTPTSLGIGPEEDKKIDKIIKNLKLL